MNYFITILFFIIFYILKDFYKKNKKNKNDVVGVGIALPIIGNLNKLIGSKGDDDDDDKTMQPHKIFNKLSKLYGDGIFKFWMGDHLVYLLSDPFIARELLINNSENFSERPRLNSIKIFSNNFKGVAFSNYQNWSFTRPFVSLSLTKTKITAIYSKIFENHTKNLISFLKSSDKLVVHHTTEFILDPRSFVGKFVLSNICSMLFSIDIEQFENLQPQQQQQVDISKLIDPIQLILRKMGAMNLDDHFWFLSPFYYFENQKSKKYQKQVYSFINDQFNKHINNLNLKNPKDLLDLLIINGGGGKENEVQLNGATTRITFESFNQNEKDNLIQVCFDVLVAGTDTSATTLEWCLLYLINNKDIQQKAYNELINLVGNNCKFIENKFKERSIYILSIIKEVLRIKPSGPLVPRYISNDCTINNIFYRKDSILFLNIYGIGNNCKYVKDSEKFIPERWINQENNIDCGSKVGGNDKKLNLDFISTPFSIGNRICPGKNVSESVVFLALSNILLNFEIDSNDGKKLDDNEVYGLTISPKPFKIKLKQRN